MTIKKGTHAPLRAPALLWKPKRLAYAVMFTSSCRYDIGAEQADINKLFGIGYLPHHHDESVRFGWRYLPKSDLIEILSYWYKRGERHFDHICNVDIGVGYTFQIIMGHSNHTLKVTGTSGERIVPLEPRKAGYLLRPYFGGNCTAPHDMTIEMEAI
jgi:hypothetical protein